MRIGWAIKGVALALGLASIGPTAAPASYHGPNGPILFEATAPGATTTDIWAVDPNGGGAVNLTDLPGGPGEGRDPSASGDGSLIAFAAGPASDSEIWVMAADGSSFERVTEPNGAIDDMPALSRDGTRIAFRTDRAGGEDIWTMGADGSAPTPLLVQPGADREPEWAGDGSALAAVSELGGDLDVVALPAAGGPYTSVANPPVADPRDSPQSVTYYDDTDQGSLSIRPDLSRIAYDTGSGGGSDIFDVFFNGTDFLPIAAEAAVAEREPAFSPDGTKLAYATPAGLVVASAGGANPKALDTAPVTNPADPEWAVGARVDSEPPQTEIERRPRNRSRRRTAAYRFAASEPSTFECKRDRRKWKSCESPLRLKRLRPGRHVFRVRATDLAGNTDPSPAVDRFRVLRRRA